MEPSRGSADRLGDPSRDPCKRDTGTLAACFDMYALVWRSSGSGCMAQEGIICLVMVIVRQCPRSKAATIHHLSKATPLEPPIKLEHMPHVPVKLIWGIRNFS